MYSLYESDITQFMEQHKIKLMPILKTSDIDLKSWFL